MGALVCLICDNETVNRGQKENYTKILASSVPVDGLTSLGARTSAGTVMIKPASWYLKGDHTRNINMCPYHKL